VVSAGPYAIICTSRQRDNHANTSSLSFFTGRMPFLPPNQQRQSTEKPALKYGENMLFHTCIELQCSQTATEINTITCTVLVKSDPTV